MSEKSFITKGLPTLIKTKTTRKRVIAKTVTRKIIPDKFDLFVLLIICSYLLNKFLILHLVKPDFLLYNTEKDDNYE